MQQVGKQLVSNNLSTPPHKLLLWNVYTNTDFEFKNKQSKPKGTKLILLHVTYKISTPIPIIFVSTYKTIYI